MKKKQEEIVHGAQLKEIHRNPEAHNGPISTLASHPRLNVIATGGDDHLWKLWNVPSGELILTGEGHEAYVSALSFHSW